MSRKAPVVIDLDPPKSKSKKAEMSPETAPPVPDVAGAGAPQGQAMQTVARFAGRRPSRLARWFWGLSALLLTTVVSLAAWSYLTALLSTAPMLGYVVTGLSAALLAVLLLIALRELAAFSRLRRIDRLQHQAREALSADSLPMARDVMRKLKRLYGGRDALEWQIERVDGLMGDQLDAPSVLALAETELMVPLDKLALKEVEAAARQVATVTAIVPLAFADVIVALTANIRMIRRIAEVYGGRSGALGSWRLTRAVLAHLVATGAVAVGDDMLGSLAGGGLLGKLSRRFGEGLVNGALTARVGVAAIEVCRPLPFHAQKRPSVSGIVGRALKGLFGS